MIQLFGDYDAIDRELNRVAGLPDAKAFEALEAVLEMAYQVTQEAVHVETGALKRSGKKQSDRSKATSSWTGEIKYGGVGGVNYAIYEKRRKIGGAGGPSDLKGNHDFFDPLKLFGPFWVAALKKGLAG